MNEKELLAYQQQLQAILVQLESLNLRKIEIEKALEELNKTKEKFAYRIAGEIMVKKSVGELKKELEEEKDDIILRIKSLEKSKERIENKLKGMGRVG